MSRLLAIGDIHGCLTALTTLVECVPILDSDLVVTLGDYVDRGPASKGILDWLIARHATGNLVPLRGNHEVMMLDAREGEDMLEEWLSAGGTATVRSYDPVRISDWVASVPESHWQFLEHDTRRYFETATHFFVHANAVPDLPLSEQPDEVLFWERFFTSLPHESGKIMVCGHTPQVSREPLNIGHAICIDTWVYRQGWLTCLDPQTGEFWQANQNGEARSGNL